VRQSQPSELGQLISRHNGRIVASLSGGWLLYLVLIVAGGSVAAAVAAKWWEAAIAFCIAAPLLVIYWRRWNQSATVYERGVVWRRGRRREVVRWDEVADVEAETIEDDFGLTITTTDGRVLQLDSLANMQQLHGYLINATRNRERPAPLSSSSLRW
jgi:hypothetical protein